MSRTPSSPRGRSTAAVHGGGYDTASGAPVASPIVQSATFVYRGGRPDEELLYTRLNNNPNHRQVGRKVAELEGMEAAVPLASGMAAVSMTLLALTEAGDHVVASRDLYGATRTLLQHDLPRRGVKTTFVDPADPGGFAAAIRPETKVVYLEIPTNPTLRVTDPRPVAELARSKGITVAADMTFASPINMRGGEWGIDVVIHSATKYLGGHSDVIAGVVAGSEALIERITKTALLYGPSLDPHATWLLDRGIRTIDVRVRRQNESALHVARWLEARPQVERAIYPGLASHPDHAVASDLMDGFGGMVSFVLKGGAAAADRFMDALELALAAPSLGGVETLVSLPRHTSHLSWTAEERDASGIPDGFVRLSIGIEDVEDLTRDLARALEAAGG